MDHGDFELLTSAVELPGLPRNRVYISWRGAWGQTGSVDNAHPPGYPPEFGPHLLTHFDCAMCSIRLPISQVSAADRMSVARRLHWIGGRPRPTGECFERPLLCARCFAIDRNGSGPAGMLNELVQHRMIQLRWRYVVELVDRQETTIYMAESSFDQGSNYAHHRNKLLESVARVVFSRLQADGTFAPGEVAAQPTEDTVFRDAVHSGDHPDI